MHERGFVISDYVIAVLQKHGPEVCISPPPSPDRYSLSSLFNVKAAEL